MEIYFLTTNKGKLQEAQLALQPMGIHVISYPVEIKEPGEGTIEEIAIDKLEQALLYLVKQDGAVWYDRSIVVDDAGIFFEAYNRFPGIFTKRLFHSIGYKGVMKLLEGENRSAYFEGVLALYRQGKKKTFQSFTYGKIAHEKSDAPLNEGFPYNSVFIPVGEDRERVFAEMNEQERLAYSYRKKAFDQLGAWIMATDLHE
jgi:XTP/dITP diphosphohydrolase